MNILPYVIPTISLTGIEILLGIDNVVILTIISSEAPPHLQRVIRFTGLLFALVVRIALLNGIFLLSKASNLVYLVGGAFLIWKGLTELFALYSKDVNDNVKVFSNISMIILQVAFFDVMFSFDSMITAIGVSTNIIAMSLAIVVSFILVMLASDFLSRLINRSPKIKIGALALVVAVGYKLVMEVF